MSSSKYQDDFPLRAEGLARDGMTDSDIAVRLGVSASAYYRWRRKYPEFDAAVRRGKAPVDAKVENALLKRALGHVCRETHIEDIIDRKTGEVTDARKRKVVLKEVAPNVSAAIFWLKSRRPEKYREKPGESTSSPPLLRFDPPESKL